MVFIVASTPHEAAKLGRRLVEERLAACVDLIPMIASTYSWQGKIEEASEILLVAKNAPGPPGSPDRSGT